MPYTISFGEASKIAPQIRDILMSYTQVTVGGSEVGRPDEADLRQVDLESLDANLVGADIGGGLMNLRQILFRPTWRCYATSARDLFICSSSTPPGGGVRSMCGYHPAKMALARFLGVA